MRGMLRRLRDEERGASLVEYALLVALIAVVCIAAVTFLGSSGSGQLDRAGMALAGEDEDKGPCYQGQAYIDGEYILAHVFESEIENGVPSTYHPGPCP
jgi:Flp pilus assembly pilin Flp